MFRELRIKIYFALAPVLKFFSLIAWKSYQRKNKKIRLVVGAGGTHFGGWFSTDIATLDLTKESDFKLYFSERKIDFVLAEHVFEHISDSNLELIIANLFKYSNKKARIRIAVPDGYHTDPVYIDYVKQGGSGAGAHDHKQLFTYKTLGAWFEKYGFEAHAVEYWDENGEFHKGYKDDDYGYVSRSFVNDDRNAGGKPVYTSLVMDFIKK